MKYSTTKIYSVKCEVCGTTDEIWEGDGDYEIRDTPTKYFRRVGWGVKTGKTLCGDCMGMGVENEKDRA